jgi:hypothetical protein
MTDLSDVRPQIGGVQPLHLIQQLSTPPSSSSTHASDAGRSTDDSESASHSPVTPVDPIILPVLVATSSEPLRTHPLPPVYRSAGSLAGRPGSRTPGTPSSTPIPPSLQAKLSAVRSCWALDCECSFRRVHRTRIQTHVVSQLSRILLIRRLLHLLDGIARCPTTIQRAARIAANHSLEFVQTTCDGN